MSEGITDQQMEENVFKEEPVKETSTEIDDFENLIEDTFEDSNPEDESLPVDNPDAAGSGNNIQGDETDAIARTTHEIMEIIAQNELIEKAKRDKIKSVIEKQEKILKKKEEELGRLEADLALIVKKRKLAKKALKKAKELKLNPDKIALIKLDIKQTKEYRKSSKGIVKQAKADIRNIQTLIELLETTL